MQRSPGLRISQPSGLALPCLLRPSHLPLRTQTLTSRPIAAALVCEAGSRTFDLSQLSEAEKLGMTALSTDTTGLSMRVFSAPCDDAAHEAALLVKTDYDWQDYRSGESATERAALAALRLPFAAALCASCLSCLYRQLFSRDVGAGSSGGGRHRIHCPRGWTEGPELCQEQSLCSPGPLGRRGNMWS